MFLGQPQKQAHYVSPLYTSNQAIHRNAYSNRTKLTGTSYSRPLNINATRPPHTHLHAYTSTAFPSLVHHLKEQDPVFRQYNQGYGISPSGTAIGLRMTNTYLDHFSCTNIGFILAGIIICIIIGLIVAIFLVAFLPR